MEISLTPALEQLRREVIVGYEAAERGEWMDGEVVFENLRAKLTQRRAQAGELSNVCRFTPMSHSYDSKIS
jgi:hypothetical protein